MNPIQTSYKPFTEESQELLLFLFYTFPPELVANSEFRDLPRNPRSALSDPATLERIHSKQFLKDMTEMTAYMVWKFLGRKGWMETYSGYSPAYILAHMLHTWMDYFYTVHEDIKPPEIIRRNLNFRWLTMGEAEDIWRSVVWFADDYVPAFREIIAIEEEYPSFMDFDLEREGVRQTRSYIDFLRKWTHGQTKHSIMLMDRVPEPKLRWLDKTDLKIDFERFLSKLKPNDRQIIALRLKGKTVVEVAEIMGYKTHSAVVKRLQRIREKYRLFSFCNSFSLQWNMPHLKLLSHKLVSLDYNKFYALSRGFIPISKRKPDWKGNSLPLKIEAGGKNKPKILLLVVYSNWKNLIFGNLSHGDQKLLRINMLARMAKSPAAQGFSFVDRRDFFLLCGKNCSPFSATNLPQGALKSGFPIIRKKLLFALQKGELLTEGL